MAPSPRRARSRYWLLVIPAVAPLLTPVYNRTEPVLWGIPFFYWYQLACAVLAIALISAVYVANRPRHGAGPRVDRVRHEPGPRREAPR
jgi:hypothetical protein